MQGMQISKHALYQLTAQNAVGVSQLMAGVHRMAIGDPPPPPQGLSLREDFCGTGLISCEWLRADATRRAVMVDIDAEPLEWGLEHNEWTPGMRERAEVAVGDSLEESASADIVCALNFSWCALRDDDSLMRYFKATRQRGELLMLDIYGGVDAYATGQWASPLQLPGAAGTYTWEHTAWDAGKQEVRAAMHFHIAPQGGAPLSIRDAFTYHWRLRPIGAVREMLLESGFAKVEGWIEERDAQGTGSGRMRRVDLSNVSTMPEASYWTMYVAAA